MAMTIEQQRAVAMANARLRLKKQSEEPEIASASEIPGAIPQPELAQEPSFFERVGAAPETAARMIYGGLTSLAAAPIGLGAEILTGTPKEQVARKVTGLGSNVPISRAAQANLESLGAVTSGLPAASPLIGQAGQIAQTANALAARATPHESNKELKLLSLDFFS